jgi:F-type H+-transporting ATPase subunit epsilon
MAKKFKTEIVTPEKIVFSEEIESLVIPAERGYLGVLAGHAPLLCTLQPGEIRIRGDRGELHYSTSGGFMEVTPGKAVLLTESAEEASAIDVKRAEESKKRAQERLAAVAKDVDKSRAKDALERALNRLRIAEKYKK